MRFQNQSETCNRPNDQRLVWVYKNLLYRLYPVLIITPLAVVYDAYMYVFDPYAFWHGCRTKRSHPRDSKSDHVYRPYHTRHFPIISRDFYVYDILHQAEVKEEWLIIL